MRFRTGERLGEKKCDLGLGKGWGKKLCDLGLLLSMFVATHGSYTVAWASHKYCSPLDFATPPCL